MKRLPWFLLFTLLCISRTAFADDVWLSFSCVDAVGSGDSYLLSTAGAGGGSTTIVGGNRMQDITNFPAGSIAATNGQSAIDELATEKQPVAAPLTTLSTKTVIGTGTDLRLSTGQFAANDYVKVDASGNLASAGSGPTGGGGTMATTTNTPAGNIAATNGQDAIDELDAEKQPKDADLTSLAGKTLQGLGQDIRFSTGSYQTNDCVKVDGNGNFATAGAPCGAGGGGGGSITINGLVNTVFTFDYATAGTDITWSAVGNTLTLNVPDASPANRGAMTAGVQTIGGAKTFDTATTVPQLNVNGSGAGTLGLLGNDALHAWGFVGADRATDLYLSATDDPAAANSILACGVPSSTLSMCSFQTPASYTAALPVFGDTTNGLVPAPTTVTGKFLRDDHTWASAGAGGGVTGPGSSTDNAVVRWDSTTGALVQNSAATIADDGTITAPALVTSNVTVNDSIAGIALTNASRIEWHADTAIAYAGVRELQFGRLTGSTATYMVHGQTGDNANSQGGKLQLGGGPGRGNVVGGAISLATALAGASGSQANPLVDHLVVNAAGTITLPDLTASLGLCTDSSKNIVSCAIGGTDASLLASGTVPLARLVNTVTVGDAPATIVAPVVDVLLTAALAASRAYTLPLANAYPAGAHLRFADAVGTLTAANTAVLTRAGSDTINGGTTFTLSTPYSSVDLVSDGTSKWAIDITGIKRGGTGATTQQAAIDALTAVAAATNEYVLTKDTGTGNALWKATHAPPATKVSMPVVGCSGTTGTLLWDVNTATAPTATCTNGGTNTTVLRGVADFIDASAHGIQQALTLPSDFVAASGMSLTLYWRTSATTGNAIWSAQVVCIPNATVDDIAFDTAATVADAALGANQMNTANISFTGASMSSCGDGAQVLHVSITRDGTTSGDTIAATASLAAVTFTYQRSGL